MLELTLLNRAASGPTGALEAMAAMAVKAALADPFLATAARAVRAALEAMAAMAVKVLPVTRE